MSLADPQRNTIRLLFALLLPCLFFQFECSERHGEAYPMIRLPSFGTSPERPGRIDLEDWELRVQFRDGSSAEIARNDLLREVPNSHRRFVLQLNFASEIAPARERALREWTLRRCRALTGRHDVVALTGQRVVTTRDPRSAEVLDRNLGDAFRLEFP